jgi:uncharacterized membrane protein YkvA (DUF1232 family)
MSLIIRRVNNLKKSNKDKNLSLVLLGLAVAYAVFPIDAVPDVVPVLGWVDDAFILISASLNTLEKTFANGSASLEKILKFAYCAFGHSGLLIKTQATLFLISIYLF